MNLNKDKNVLGEHNISQLLNADNSELSSHEPLCEDNVSIQSNNLSKLSRPKKTLKLKENKQLEMSQ